MDTTIKAVLFDLDGTLLTNPMYTFMPEYFRLIADFSRHVMEPEAFIRHLKMATRAMTANEGRTTNEEAFAEAFYPLNGHPREEMEPLFEEFYSTRFSLLRPIATRKEEARAVAGRALELGLRVVVATNPLFPESAIRQRMEWAGVGDLPFSLVTTYENSRASKPSALYYQDIAAHIGAPPEQCLMVGDEDWDIAACRAGCRTFLVPGENTRRTPKSPTPDWEGTLADAGRLVDRLMRD